MPVKRTDPKYLAVLVFACLGILFVGALLRPTLRQGEAAPASVAADILQLERVAQRREVDLIADYFAHVASLVEDSVVLLTATGQSGVIWQAGEVLTSSRIGPFPAGDRTALGSQEVELTTKAAAPHLPYVLLDAPLSASVSDRGQVRLYARGSWLLSAWRSPAGGLRYASGTLFGVAMRRCGEVELEEVQTNLNFQSMQPGAGIFSLDGGLIAIALDCGGSLIAAEVGALELLVRAEKSFEDQLMERYGMRLGQVNDSDQALFGRQDGVVVREIWWGYRAHQAGLMPGDFLLSLDGAEIETLADLQALVLPVSREVHELRIWRSGRQETVRLLARAARALAVSAHGFIGGQGGLPIEFVIRGSLAERAGAQPGDYLLEVNRRAPESFEDLEASLQREQDQPLYFTLLRRGRIWGTLVQADE